jgi:hypothetical protein
MVEVKGCGLFGKKGRNAWDSARPEAIWHLPEMTLLWIWKGLLFKNNAILKYKSLEMHMKRPAICLRAIKPTILLREWSPRVPYLVAYRREALPSEFALLSAKKHP